MRLRKEATVHDDVEARFRDWAAESRSRLRQMAFLLSGDWFLADDLVQETLIRILAAWPRLPDDSDITHYSRKVLLNLYLDHRRRPSRRERVAEVVPDSPVPDAETGLRDTLHAALQRLPPGQRAVLVLRFFEDLSVDQTAEALGVSSGTVKSQTNRGLTTLRRTVAEFGLTHRFDFQEQA